MAKKIIAWLLVVVLTAGAAIGGTLAYLTDRDSEANVFTTGDVKIDLEEDFTENSPMIPGEEINKDVQIKNNGSNAAWVWYTYAIPQALDGNIDLIYSNEIYADSVEAVQEVLAPEYPDSNVKIVLTEDLVIDKNTPMSYTDSNGAHFQIWKNKNITFDLNGHKITVKEDALKDGTTYANALFLVRNASFTLVGPGEIEVNNKATAIYCWQDQYQKHSVSIYGDVKITADSHERIKNGKNAPESIVYVNHADDDATTKLDKHLECHVYGGTYDGYAINIADKCSTTHELRDLLILHEGVRMGSDRWDLFESDYNAGRIRLAEGCEVVNIDGWYTVVGSNGQVNNGGSNNGSWTDGQLVGTMEKDGVVYNVYSRLFSKVLLNGETTPVDLSAVMLAEYVDITPDGQLYKVVNGETAMIDWNINQNNGDSPIIYVSAYAIQADGIDNIYAAYAAYNAQWGSNGVVYGSNDVTTTESTDPDSNNGLDG